MRFNRFDMMTQESAVACAETQKALAASNAIIDSALASYASRKPIEKLNMAQCVERSSDPYQAAINSCAYRGADTNARTQTFTFDDKSELVFDAVYTVRKS